MVSRNIMKNAINIVTKNTAPPSIIGLAICQGVFLFVHYLLRLVVFILQCRTLFVKKRFEDKNLIHQINIGETLYCFV